MAKIDDLLSEVSDGKLRGQLTGAVADLRRRKKFGLVYEEHIPETVLLPAAGIRVGSIVMLRRKPHDKMRYLVKAVKDGYAMISDGAGATQTLSLADLLIVKPFGEPVYPVLKQTCSLTRAEGKPYHTVINGENFHALQLLLFAFEGQVDCIYIDPPYNTGARDWKYNNDYVDDQDSWRHSKWLSYMEKRLKLAKKLLKSDGVLIVTIDEKEVHHLGVLIEELFPEAVRQMVTIVINPLGQARKQELARVDEYAFFVFLGNAQPCPVTDDLLTDSGTDEDSKVRWERLLRGGTNSRREDRPNLFFPIFVNPETRSVISVGNPLPLEEDRSRTKVPDGVVAVWPLRGDGAEGNWRCSPKYLKVLLAAGHAKVGTYDAKNDHWSFLYLGKAQLARIESGEITVLGRDKAGAVILEQSSDSRTTRTAKTVWYRLAHRAGEHGSALLKRFLPGCEFPFPKSLYAVEDALRIAVADNPDALILDFFAGSGTTLHATVLLNSEDDGQRRCVLVTNNEVDEKTAKSLNAKGHYRGDPEFELNGICQAVTVPRTKAALSGSRPDGSAVIGNYIGGRDFSDGFDENAAFFDLVYDDPDVLEAGIHFEDIIPALWLGSGCLGDPKQLKPDASWLLQADSPFAVLLDEDRFQPFLKELSTRLDINHVWLVTDSDVGSHKNCRCISQNLSLYARFFVSISKTALMSLIEIVIGLLSSHRYCRWPTV